MDILTTFWIGALEILFLIAIVLLTVFKVGLTKLKAQAIDSRKLETFNMSKPLSKLLDNVAVLLRAINFAHIASVTAMGILVYPLFLSMKTSMGGVILEDYFAVSIVMAWALLIALLYLVEDVAMKATHSVCKYNDLKSYSSSIILLSKLLKPAIWFVEYCSDILLKLFKVNDESSNRDIGSTLHIATLGYPETALSPQLLKIIKNTIRFPELDVSDVMLPRNQIQFLDVDNPIADNIEVAKSTGHTRFPLCEGGLDQCFAIIHIKDVFHYQGDLNTLDLTKFQHQLIRFPEETSLEDALKKFQKFKIHMAIVVDRFGGILGLLTLEDILEELVGNIQDEFDHEDALIVPISKNVYRVSGLVPLHELESTLNITINNETVSTFGGLITAEIGRIPEKNERLECHGLKIKINEVSKKRVISATIRLAKPSDS